MYQESVIHDVWWPCSWGQTQGRVSWRVFRSPRRDSQRWWWTGSRPSCGREKRLSRVETKSRSISTVEGSGATCTRIFFELFFQNRWSFYGPVDPKKLKKVKKKKTPKMHWHHTKQMVMVALVTSGKKIILPLLQPNRWTFWRVWDFSTPLNMSGGCGKIPKSKVI